MPTRILGLSAFYHDSAAALVVDGELVGETPLMSLPTALGTHEVVFRSEKYGEVSYTVKVTLTAPVRLKVAFSKR